MRISIQNLGKKFGSTWVFKNLNETIESGDKVAIIGNNGSGKSTLLQLMSGLALPSSGTLIYSSRNGDKLNSETALFKMNFAAPYSELIEEFSLVEFLSFHFKFRELSSGLEINELINILYLNGNEDKRIKNFSSGMKQRLKLGLAFYTVSEVVFLDEPTTNLDTKGVNWYLEQIQQQIGFKTIVVSSNQKSEYLFCDKIIDMGKELNK